MKKVGITINFNLSNRVIYTLIALLIIVIVGVGVYAFTTDGSGIPSVMGHSADELDGLGTLATKDSINWNEVGLPNCSNGEIIKWDNGNWICGIDVDYCAGGNCNGNLRVGSHDLCYIDRCRITGIPICEVIRLGDDTTVRGVNMNFANSIAMRYQIVSCDYVGLGAL